MLNNHEKDRLRKIIKKAVSGNKEWLNHRTIWIGDKGDYCVLNYGIGQRNDSNCLVRGMIVRKPTVPVKDELDLIVSFPFCRFYNQHEKEAASINFKNADMLEKLDGCFVGVFYDGEWRWHTRRMISTHAPDMEMTIAGFHGGNYNFMKLIGEYVKKVNVADKNLTYMFEFIHEATMVWTKYQPEQYGLYLIGARNIKTFKEHSEEELNKLIEKLGVFRPRIWDTVEEEEAIFAKMKEICKSTPDFEGFVFRDRNTGDRIKVKDPEYVKWHHMIGKVSYKRLTPLFLKGEADEVIAYFPVAKERIEKIKEKLYGCLDNVVKLCIEWKNRAKEKRMTRKAMAFEVFSNKWDKFTCQQIMKNFEENNDKAIYNNVKNSLWTMGGAGNTAGQVKRLLDLIGINDDDEDSVE